MYENRRIGYQDLISKRAVIFHKSCSFQYNLKVTKLNDMEKREALSNKAADFLLQIIDSGGLDTA